MISLLSALLMPILLCQVRSLPIGMTTSASASGNGPCYRPDNKPATCAHIPDLQCHNTTVIQVCNWATMEVVEVKCVYNHFAKRCQPSRKWDIYVSRTPCEVHKGRTTCERAISPESLHYASQRNCQWIEGKSDVQGMCRSPLPAFFYLLTREGSIFRVDPYQKQLQYVREDESVTAIASDADTMTGMFMTKQIGHSEFNLFYLNNIEKDATEPKDLGVQLPGRIDSNSALGENIDGRILTATGQQVYLYNPHKPKKGFTNIHNDCSLHFTGDLAGQPAKHSNSTSQDKHLYMISHDGQLVQTPPCKTYKPVKDMLHSLGFTCNGELYVGSKNKIYRIRINEQNQPDGAEEIITLEAHTIRSFASQPGCNLYNSRRRR